MSERREERIRDRDAIDHRDRDRDRDRNRDRRKRSRSPDHRRHARSRTRSPDRRPSPSAERPHRRHGGHHDRRSPSPDAHRRKRRREGSDDEGDRRRHRATSSDPADGVAREKKKPSAPTPAPDADPANGIGAVPTDMDPDELEMMKKLGIPLGFDSTKGKPVAGNDVSAVRVVTKRQPRQYMNRRGGFNRPLPLERNR